MGKKVLCFAFAILLVCNPANSNFNTSFEDTFNKWLAYLGFDMQVSRVSKTFDVDGFIDSFDLLLQETSKKSFKAERKYQRDLNTYIGVSLPPESKHDSVVISIFNKDIQDIPFMWSDWVGKLVFSYALKKIASTLGFELKIKKVTNDNYQATILPAKSTAPTRYRFDQITIVYNLKDLILNAVVRVYSKPEYLPLQFGRGELHAVVRALEQGLFPGATTSLILASKLSQESLSDYLLRETLGRDEESYSNPEELERILPLKAVEEGRELVL